MVSMRVGIDHCRNGQARADVLLKQLPRRARRFCRHQRVEHDPARLAANESDVGKVEPTDLIDARDDFV